MFAEAVKEQLTDAQGGGAGEVHVAQGFVDAADVGNFQFGQNGGGFAQEGIAAIAFVIVGSLGFAPGFDVAHEAGIFLECFFGFHIFEVYDLAASVSGAGSSLTGRSLIASASVLAMTTYRLGRVMMAVSWL